VLSYEIQAACETSSYGLRPWKGGGHHDQKGGIGNIIEEPEGRGLTQEELEALSGVLAKMFRDMSARGRQDPFLGEEEIFAEE